MPRRFCRTDGTVFPCALVRLHGPFCLIRYVDGARPVLAFVRVASLT